VGVGARDWTPFGPTSRVSETASENGPPRGVGAVAFRRDDVRVGAIGCRWNGVGDEGGVKPDPDEGSSIGGDATSGGEDIVSGVLSMMGGVSTGAEDVFAVSDDGLEPRRSSRDICIRESRTRSRIAIPYGE
jgi:hypothetical protein